MPVSLHKFHSIAKKFYVVSEFVQRVAKTWKIYDSKAINGTQCIRSQCRATHFATVMNIALLDTIDKRYMVGWVPITRVDNQIEAGFVQHFVNDGNHGFAILLGGTLL